MILFFRAAIFLLLLSVQFCRPAWAQEGSVTLPPAQIILEPHLVQIILNDEHRQGVDWEAIVSDFHQLSLKKESFSEDKGHSLSVGAISNEDYSVLLEALDAVGQVSQTPFEPVTVVLDAPLRIDFNTPDHKDTMTVGTKFTVTSKGEKQLSLFPEIFNRKASTEIILKESTTIVLGSMFSEREVTKTHKFPLLGDLPIVGLVFRNKGKLMQKIETIIFLTPKG